MVCSKGVPGCMSKYSLLDFHEDSSMDSLDDLPNGCLGASLRHSPVDFPTDYLEDVHREFKFNRNSAQT